MGDTMNGSEHDETLSSSSLLGAALGSISSPRSSSSEFSKTYKQASNFYLTRRFPEALSAIKPLITTPENGEETDEEKQEAAQAPVASADRKWRIKLWSFYISLLNQIAELEDEDGKAAFGNKEWRSLTAKAQDGSVWEEVVIIGYGGIEGNVDPEVVVNLANLLLAQSDSQKANQQRLETYLSASSSPSLDATTRLGHHVNGHINRDTSPRNGPYTNHDLEIRLQIIELYVLHVLVRNGEWEYAGDFIKMAEDVPEDRREAFLRTLSDMHEQELADQEEDLYEDAVPQQTEERSRQLSSVTSMDSATTIKARPPSVHRRVDSEKDYGIEDTAPKAKAPAPKPAEAKPARKLSHNVQANSSRQPPIKSIRNPSNTGVFKSSLATLSALQNFVYNITQQISRNPMSLFRFLLFLIGLIVAVSRRDVKERLGRLTGAGWDKIRRTVGMGVKVSYI